MLQKLRQLFRRESWQDTLNRLQKELVPIAGESGTLQGELVRCINNLNDEAHRNGWINFDEADIESLDVLRRYLPDASIFSQAICQQIHISLDAVRYAGERGADEGKFGYDELTFLAQRVAEWCHSHSELIHKRPEATWLDESPVQ
jgi:hypothetical protein